MKNYSLRSIRSCCSLQPSNFVSSSTVLYMIGNQRYVVLLYPWKKAVQQVFSVCSNRTARFNFSCASRSMLLDSYLLTVLSAGRRLSCNYHRACKAHKIIRRVAGRRRAGVSRINTPQSKILSFTLRGVIQEVCNWLCCIVLFGAYYFLFTVVVGELACLRTRPATIVPP